MNEMNNGRSFTDILIVIVEWRKFIIYNTLVVTLATIVVLLLMDNWYASTASIVPPRKKGGLFGDISASAGKLKDITKALGRIGSGTDESFDYLTVLQSRNASEKVINKFNLRQVYKIKENAPIEEVFEELKSNVRFNVEDEGNITIWVQDKNPNQAAAMANYYVQILNQISLELSTFESKNNRIFLENRYLQVLSDLKNSEERIRTFSKNNKLIALDEQTKSSIKEIAEIKGQLMLTEIQYEIAKKNLGDNSPVLFHFDSVIEKLEAKLKVLTKSSEFRKDENWEIPLDRISDLGIEKIRIQRDFEIQTKLFEFILPIYEQAKIEEKKDIPVCLVLDEAVPAQRKSSPKRGIIAISVFLLIFILSSMLALMINAFRSLKEDNEKYKKIQDGLIIPIRKMLFLKP